MIFSYNWLKDYISGKVPSPKKLAEVLTFHSFEVEGVTKKGRDWILDIDVLPNRACDCLSHLGVASEVAAILGLKLTNCNFFAMARKLQLGEEKAGELVKIEVKNAEDCERYTATLIKGIKVKPSPTWLQDRLKACGLQPINNIVDIANYVMLETGQPIHAFDLDKVGKKIIVRRAKKGECLKTLDDKTYRLDEDILVIADTKRPIAIAGIKGGQNTGVDKKTKNLLIEAANFNQRLTRRASRKLKLKTDASWRFENGLDPNLIDFAQKRVCSLIQELAGGRLLKGMVDFYPKKILPKKIKLDLDYVNKLLGLEIPKQTIIKILKALGFKCSEVCSEVRPQNIIVEVPTRRLDVSIPEDLIEEIGRVYGYQNIPSTFPQTALIPPARNDEIFWQRIIENILKEAGFYEVYNYSFIGEKEKTFFDYWRLTDLIEVSNPISSWYKYLRPSLIPNLLKNVKENLKNFEEIKIFEIGKTFNRQKGLPIEKKMVAGVLMRKGLNLPSQISHLPKFRKAKLGQASGEIWEGEEGFFELKGVVDSLLSKLGVTGVWYDEVKPTPEESHLAIWHPGAAAEIKVNGEEIGFLGEIHPGLVDGLGIKERCFCFDLDFEKLLQWVSEEHEYQPLSVYPASLRDLAILVPQGTRVEAVLNKIEAAGGTLVRDVDLFDIYTGEGVPEGKLSFAFHIVYQAEDRTLTSQEVDKIHQKIVEALEEEPEWEVRK